MKLSCIEAEWDWDPFNTVTVAPMLALLEAERVAQCARRDAVTEKELLFLVERWATGPAFRGFRYLYVACRGESGKTWFAERGTSISEAAQRISRCSSAKDRVVHFGACSVLADDRLAEEFMTGSGIGVLYGYAKPVDWMESAVLDLILMTDTAECFSERGALSTRRHRERIGHFLADHSTMVERLGLRVWTRKAGKAERLLALPRHDERDREQDGQQAPGARKSSGSPGRRSPAGAL